MKDAADTRLAPRISGYIGANLCRYLKNVDKAGYDYGSVPFVVPEGVILDGNVVQTMDQPFEWTPPLDLSNAPPFTETSMIAFYSWLRDALPEAARDSVGRTIAALQGFEAYDPMEQGDMEEGDTEQGGTDAVAKVEADLAAAQIALGAAQTSVTAAQKGLTQVVGLNSRLGAVRAALQRKQAKIESAITVLGGDPP